MTQKTVEELKQEYLKECKDTNSSVFTILGKAMNYIVALEDAQTPNWTKLPELPTDEGWYLATIKGDDFYYVGTGFFNGMEFIYTCDAEVVAWMPLPEPFKGEV